MTDVKDISGLAIGIGQFTPTGTRFPTPRNRAANVSMLGRTMSTTELFRQDLYVPSKSGTIEVFEDHGEVAELGGTTTPGTATISAKVTPLAVSHRLENVGVSTPRVTPKERFPLLGNRPTYDAHRAATVAPPRFRTPTHASLAKRPMTSQKPEMLRKAIFKSTTPTQRTMTSTPMKTISSTPSQEPLTPHPAAPLRGVVAMVEVFTNEGASASSTFVQLLQRLGAKTTKTWSDRVTHVVFKDGPPATLQRVRLHNKAVEESGGGMIIHCINSRWVSDCDAQATRMNETAEDYAVEVDSVSHSSKRRRKSMEPKRVSLGRASLSRKSLSRPSVGFASPAISSVATTSFATPEFGLEDKENMENDDSSPMTPGWLRSPDKLIQQTAPLNRMRKLQVKENARGNRRLTFFNGAS